MEGSVKERISSRKSVRTYDGTPLLEEDRRKLEECIKSLKNPFGVPVEFRILDAKKAGVSSFVVLGADTYVGAKVPRVPNAELAFGYEFEHFVLSAHSLGLGTVWLAATIDRPAFERAMDVGDNEVMPAVTPIGYPAEKRSVRESLMRKTLRADERLSFAALFFQGSFLDPLAPDEAGPFKEALEMVRLAPSAGNKQPWRAILCGNTVHFYEKKAKSLSNNPLGDIQKVDVGIALLHFALVMEESGMEGRFFADDPKIEKAEDTEYVVSYRMGD